MTLADAKTGIEEQGELIEPLPPEDEPRVGTRSPRRAWKRNLALVVLSLLAVGLVVAVFAGPLERVWYRTRQHHLAADLKVARPSVAPGQALGVLQVPRLGINVVVVEGDTPTLLRGAPGHRVSTAKPGAKGNSLIMGHHSAWGAPFADLDRIRRGDLLAFQTRHGKTFVYVASSIRHISAGDTHLLRPAKDHRLTLVTGRGGRFSNDKLVVTAVSGPAARTPYLSREVRATTPGGSVILSTTLLLAVVAFSLAAGAIYYLRRRVRTLALVVVAVPLLAAGTLLLLLDLSLLLPPLA